MDLPGLLDRALPAPGRGAGYAPSEFTLPLVLMLHGGGRTLEDLRQVRMDAGPRALLRLDRMPSSDATGDWLRRSGSGAGLGMERMPSGDFGANAVFFRIGILAYNLFVLFKLVALPESWRRHQVRTIHWRLYQVAGKVVNHTGSVWLKVRRRVFGILEEVRSRCVELARA